MRAQVRVSWRRVLVVGVAIAATMLAACSKDNPRAAASGNPSITPGAVDRCATPNEGCACDVPDQVVDCGKIKYQSGDNVACEMGKRTCSAGHWGACIGETYGVKGQSLHIRSLKLLALADAGVTCTGSDTACDPFACYQLADDTTGLTDAGPGMQVTEGGLSPLPASDAGAVVTIGAYQGATNGVTACTGAANVGVGADGVGQACTPGGYDVCGQDYRCDPVTSKCIWNGGPGYYDATLPTGTIDLTVATPCGDSGSASATASFCNRGNVAIPTGAVVEIWQQASPTAGAGCAAPTGTQLTSVTLAEDMPPGQCASVSLGNSAGSKAITVYLTSGATESSPYCNNNSAVYKTDGDPGCAACNSCTTLTSITGKVYDPSGIDPAPTAVTPADTVATRGANATPLAGISVFQPAGALTPLADGLVCDTCDSVSSPAVYKTLTNGTGAFTLYVTPGKNVPITVQTGRWRRTVLVDVQACQDNDFEAAGKKGTFRLPRGVTDGYGGTANLPKLAITTGNQESLECLLTKIGVKDDQFAKYSDTDTHRVQLFKDNGMDISGGAPAASSLFTSTVLPKFNAVLSDCGGSHQDLYEHATNTMKGALRDYVNAGGRYFGDHYAAQDFLQHNVDASWTAEPASPGAAGVIDYVDTTGVGDANKVLIVQGQTAPAGASAAQAQLKTWMEAVGANGGFTNAFTSATNPAKGMRWVGDKATAWFASNGALDDSCGGSPPNNCQTNWDGSYYANNDSRRILSASFRSGNNGTPGDPSDDGVEKTCGQTDGYGIVLFNEMHVSESRTSGNSFPSKCVDNTLAPEEKALEYQIFQLTACNPGSLPPSPTAPTPPETPPPVTKYAATTYIRDFTATCPFGTHVSWSYFYWSANIPTTDAGTGPNIVFTAASNDDVNAIPATPDPNTSVTIGTASVTATNATDIAGAPYNTTTAPVSVSAHFKIDPPLKTPAQPPIQSGNYLRVYMTFNPSSDQTKVATLVDWKATYDCVDAE
jgi:hypothetical protein